MAAITIDSPRWLDGWGQPLSQPRPQPALRLVGGAGTRRPDPTVYRRRRRVALAVVVMLLSAMLAAGWSMVSRAAVAGEVPQGRAVHVVEPGETYWSIAADSTDADRDLRLAVDELIDANGGRPLFAGDRIEIP